MPSPRTHRRRGIGAVPTMLENAPMDALRSHLYPVQPEAAAIALQVMSQPGGPPRRVFLPLTFGQQQWKKLARWTWRDAYATRDSFAQVYNHPTTTFTARLNHGRYPGQHDLSLQQISQELTDTAFESYRHIDPDEMPDARYPLGRGISYPTPLPVSAFDQLDELERFAAQRTWANRLAHREAVVRRMAELDAEYGKWTWKP